MYSALQQYREYSATAHASVCDSIINQPYKLVYANNCVRYEVALDCTLGAATLLVASSAYPSKLENGSNTLFRNVGKLLPDYMTSHLTR
jgi:hypothetical protein